MRGGIEMKSTQHYRNTAAGTDAKRRTPIRMILISGMMMMVDLFCAKIIRTAIPVLTWQRYQIKHIQTQQHANEFHCRDQFTGLK
jgi:hypothetical protein